MDVTTPIGPRVTVQPNPRDTYSRYTALWLLWILAFAIIEGKALYDEAHAQPGNRVKRTLSAHLRSWAAYDSATGIPLGVKHGKVRRLVMSTALNWFGRHIAREGEM